jgi:hypothetical protein
MHSLPEILLKRHHINTYIERMLCATEENSVDWAHVAVIASPCNGDVAI